MNRSKFQKTSQTMDLLCGPAPDCNCRAQSVSTVSSPLLSSSITSPRELKLDGKWLEYRSRCSEVSQIVTTLLFEKKIGNLNNQVITPNTRPIPPSSYPPLLGTHLKSTQKPEAKNSRFQTRPIPPLLGYHFQQGGNWSDDDLSVVRVFNFYSFQASSNTSPLL